MKLNNNLIKRKIFYKNLHEKRLKNLEGKNENKCEENNLSLNNNFSRNKLQFNNNMSYDKFLRNKSFKKVNTNLCSELSMINYQSVNNKSNINIKSKSKINLNNFLNSSVQKVKDKDSINYGKLEDTKVLKIISKKTMNKFESNNLMNYLRNSKHLKTKENLINENYSGSIGKI